MTLLLFNRIYSDYLLNNLNSVKLVNSVLSLSTELITSIAIYHVVLSITDCILTLISYMVQKHGEL